MSYKCQISLDNVAKKYIKEWVIKGISYDFFSGVSYAVIGPNGSGKSTLLQLISGISPISSGKIDYSVDNQTVTVDDIYQYVAMAAPAQELIEEFTLQEAIEFHLNLRPLIYPTVAEFAQKVFLENQLNKPVKYFSSGMKQRLKLGFAIFSEVPILLLDEPTTNLDAFGIEWYQRNVRECLKNKLVIVSSNQPHEYDFCEKTVNIVDFK